MHEIPFGEVLEKLRGLNAHRFSSRLQRASRGRLRS